MWSTHTLFQKIALLAINIINTIWLWYKTCNHSQLYLNFLFEKQSIPKQQNVLGYCAILVQHNFYITPPLRQQHKHKNTKTSHIQKEWGWEEKQMTLSRWDTCFLLYFSFACSLTNIWSLSRWSVEHKYSYSSNGKATCPK